MLLVAGFHEAAGATLPTANARFLLLCALGGLLQIGGTNLLIMAFGYRSFVVGSAYAKTEAAQGAILAFFLLHEALTPLAILGIAVGVGGVLVLSLAGRGLHATGLLRATLQPAALCGLGTGAAFALTGICIKEANRALGTGGGVEAIVRQAVFALLVTNLLQTLMQGSYLALREPDQLRAAFRTWRRPRPGWARSRPAARPAGSPAFRLRRWPWCVLSARSRWCSRCCSRAFT